MRAQGLLWTTVLTAALSVQAGSVEAADRWDSGRAEGRSQTMRRPSGRSEWLARVVVGAAVEAALNGEGGLEEVQAAFEQATAHLEGLELGSYSRNWLFQVVVHFVLQDVVAEGGSVQDVLDTLDEIIAWWAGMSGGGSDDPPPTGGTISKGTPPSATAAGDDGTPPTGTTGATPTRVRSGAPRGRG